MSLSLGITYAERLYEQNVNRKQTTQILDGFEKTIVRDYITADTLLGMSGVLSEHSGAWKETTDEEMEEAIENARQIRHQDFFSHLDRDETPADISNSVIESFVAQIKMQMVDQVTNKVNQAYRKLNGRIVRKSMKEIECEEEISPDDRPMISNRLWNFQTIRLSLDRARHIREVQEGMADSLRLTGKLQTESILPLFVKKYDSLPEKIQNTWRKIGLNREVYATNCSQKLRALCIREFCSQMRFHCIEVLSHVLHARAQR